jgi:hypothetical protein
MKHIVPKEALNWFANKNLKPSFNHLDVYGQEHSKAFTVAKAMELDVLVDIRDAAQKALADGQTFQQFRAELTPTLQKKGWWGRQEMTDPQDGRLKEVQLGSARRLRTIYRTNMRTARAAGQWQRIQRTSTSHPYLIYSLGPSENHRQEHVSWNKLVLPVNDPFWKTHYPPNGWGCNCRVRQASAAEAKRLGINTAPKIETSEWVNKRTGEVHQIPKGIDPSWHHNPGENPNQPIDLFAQKLDAAPMDLAQAFVNRFVQGPVFDRWFESPQGLIPMGILNTDLKMGLSTVKQAVKLSDQGLASQLSKVAALSLAEYKLLPLLIKKGRYITQGNRRLVYWEHKGLLYRAVIAKNDQGELEVLSYFRAKDRDMRRDMRKGEQIKGWSYKGGKA